jgi:hypothetical protein
MEINIGRATTKGHFIKVPDQYREVSRNHATITIDDDSFFIQDHSTHGTFINGQKFKKKKLNVEDEVLLANLMNGFQIDLKEIVNLYNSELQKNKTDFSKEFLQLKKVYINYENEIKKATSLIQLKSAMPKIAISIIAIILLILIDMPNNLRYPLMMGVGILGTLLTVKSNTTINIQKAQEKLMIKYNNEYVCPKCRNKLGINRRSWDFLKAEGMCPHKNCDATY